MYSYEKSSSIVAVLLLSSLHFTKSMNLHNERYPIPASLKLTEKVISEIGTIYFYDRIVVVEINEGITLSYKNGFSLLLKGLQYLGTKPWVYVSHRVSSYSVKPTDYKYLNKIPNLKGICLAVHTDTQAQNAKLEEAFVEKPFLVANSLHDAIVWAEEILSPKPLQTK
ncbi:hypothetical protein [Luteirhabdus pelagi]|uniref:hypothetical protein n=1 Tax=Luteirhabdus pelagi TaxID=2792783 RepID=UPI0019398900|nr:hypothetical protein [Luteirhabdus pelagi]